MVTVRFQPAERKTLDGVAHRSGKTLSDWIRTILLTAASEAKLETSEAEGVGVQPHRQAGSFGGL